MRFETKAMDAPAAEAAGDAILVERFTEKTVHVGGTFEATLRVQGSLDGTNWGDVSEDIDETGPQVVAVPHTVRYLRINVTAFTSGAPEVSFGGFDARAV